MGHLPAGTLVIVSSFSGPGSSAGALEAVLLRAAQPSRVTLIWGTLSGQTSCAVGGLLTQTRFQNQLSQILPIIRTATDH